MEPLTDRELDIFSKLFDGCVLVRAYKLGAALQQGLMPPRFSNDGNDIGWLVRIQKFLKRGSETDTWWNHYVNQDIPCLLIKRLRDNYGHYQWEIWKARRSED